MWSGGGRGDGARDLAVLEPCGELQLPGRRGAIANLGWPLRTSLYKPVCRRRQMRQHGGELFELKGVLKESEAV